MLFLRHGHSDYLPLAPNNLAKPLGTVGNSKQPSRNLGNSVTWLVEQHTVWLQASAAKLRSALFWVITQRVVVISYRRFGTDRLSRNVGKSYHCSLRNNPDVRSSQQRFINTGCIQWRYSVTLRIHFGIIYSSQTVLVLHTQLRDIHIDEISLTHVGNPSLHLCHAKYML
jgi:hypothetical protein